MPPTARSPSPRGPRQALHRPAGTSPAAPFATQLTPADCGWTYSSLRVLDLPPGGEAAFGTGPDEMLVLPLAGACTVTADGEELALAGRPDVFTRVTDFAYVPRDATVTVRSEAGGRFALPGARATRRLPPRYGRADQVPVEIRGSGQASRQVNNFCAPGAFETDRLISVEVLTPAGNWSSYPPHKHDEAGPGEAVLEEIYYFEVGGGPGGPGIGYQRVYSTDPGRPADVLAEVRTGDIVLVPHGYHGPSMAPPGYDLYYLNVLAGPAEERTMAFCDDPAHGWVRGTWAGQPVDPRLPMARPVTGEEER
ncbi:MAG TPA: 5-deoxy-glucuronate isomerase [Streptosporangiaceae bacterium]|nr:5-deoxy-glucuronate isomerase [Streptosporangiaceae bacterium]